MLSIISVQKSVHDFLNADERVPSIYIVLIAFGFAQNVRVEKKQCVHIARTRGDVDLRELVKYGWPEWVVLGNLS